MQRAALVSSLLLVAFAGIALPSPGAEAQRKEAPVRLLFDTDIGPDVDDVGTTAVLHALANRGEARILGMACCTSNEWGAACLDALNTYFGRPDLPVGTFKGSGFLPDSKYARNVAEEFPNDLRSGKNAPDATALYRRLLTRAKDRSVVVCATGPLNNLARLLDSGPDETSRLSGLELVRRKVQHLSVMGGRYPEGKEWNFEQDPAAAARVASAWPTPIVFSGFEIGVRVKTGARQEAEAPKESPVRRAYALYIGAGKDRESWDQTALLAAVRGGEAHWSVRSGGTVTIDPKTGFSRWTPAPDGKHSYLVERDPVESVKKVIDDLMLAVPGAQ